jgi:hypothetical protein
MFGFLLRAAPQALFVALLGAVASKVLQPIIDVSLAGPATEQDLLISSLVAVTDNFVLAGLLGLLLTLIARAVIEARLGGV